MTNKFKVFNCKNCNKELKKRQKLFCSNPCGKQYWVKNGPTPNWRDERQCVICKTTFTPKTFSAKTCSVQCSKINTKNPAFLRTRFEVLQRDGFRCFYCGKNSNDNIKLEVDHIFPKSRGGTDSKDNLITACNLCNGGKLDFILKQYE